MLDEFDQGRPPDRLEANTLQPVFTADELRAAQIQLAHVKVEPELIDYILKITRASREKCEGAIPYRCATRRNE